LVHRGLRLSARAAAASAAAGLFACLLAARCVVAAPAVAQGHAALFARDQSLQRLRGGARRSGYAPTRRKAAFLAIASTTCASRCMRLGLFARRWKSACRDRPKSRWARNMMRSIDGPRPLVNAMLDISRLDAGTIEPNVQQFALRDVFRRHAHAFRRTGRTADWALRLARGANRSASDPQLLEAHPRQPGAERDQVHRGGGAWWWRARRARTSTSKCGHRRR